MPTPQQERKFPFKLGADPEFTILFGKRCTNAARIVTHIMQKSSTPVQEVDKGFKVGKYGNIGWDGYHETGEVRPAPSDKPDTLAENIEQLLTTLLHDTQILDIDISSKYQTCGGHIHFDLPFTSSELNSMSSQQLNNAVAKISRTLNCFYLPIMMSEDKLNIKVRNRKNYGQFGQDRLDEKTFEYRVPTAEWMISKKIAVATLAYMGVVYNEITNHPETFKKYNDILYRNKNQGDALYELIINEYESLTNILLSRIKKYIKTFELYPIFKNEIDFILNPKAVRAEKAKYNSNAALGWGIAQNGQPTKRALLSDKKVKEVFSRINADAFIELLHIPFNKDTNVEMFVEALKQRIIAFNWKMNNNYFFFGLRKGIQGFVAMNGEGQTALTVNEDMSKADGQNIKEITERMMDRYRSTCSIDRNSRKSYVVVGIPYDARINNDIKSMLSFVHEFESGRIPVKERNELDAIIEGLPAAKTNSNEDNIAEVVATHSREGTLSEYRQEAREHPAPWDEEPEQDSEVL